jgi:UDP-N-acetylmuramate dehydrogenase
MEMPAENIPLKAYNTFGIDVKARYFSTAGSTSEIISLVDFAKQRALTTLILGGGSNVLFTQDYHGLVILNKIPGIYIREVDENSVIITSGAGVIWNDLVSYSINHGFGGIENLSLIPGNVGAAPMQNIGAYGVELRDVFYTLDAIETHSGIVKTFTPEECSFGYRTSVFKDTLKDKYIIVSVSLKLSKKPRLNISYGAIGEELERMHVSDPSVQDVSKAVCRIRMSKLPDPDILGNAGSFFKNPEVPDTFHNTLKDQFPDLVSYPVKDGRKKIAAGWMIEFCGWKGKVVGNTGAHKNQALVIVNYGNATGSEIQHLAEQIQVSVFGTFGIKLEPEVNII